MFFFSHQVAKRKKAEEKKKNDHREKKREKKGEKDRKEIMDEGVKEALANEENTKRDALTRSDRQTLRCYFGFTKCVQIPSFPVKDKNSVNGFIRRMLFENDNKSKDVENSKRTDGRVDSDTASEKAAKDAQNEEDDEPFDLNVLLTRDVPTIFPWTLDSLKDMFLEASRFTDNQIIAVLRSFTSFDRLYSSDLAISTGFVRLLLVGPVWMKRERETVRQRERETDK